MKRIAFMLITIIFVLMNTMPAAAQEESEEQEEIIYNILVDRYNNGNFERDEQVQVDDSKAYHGGDLEGVINKLDELKEIGITTISLSPLMENASDGYHGYWIEDFYSVEEQFGTMEDLHTLIDEAHARDIKVVMEFVTNYVASSHSIVDDPETEDWVQESNDLNVDWADNVAVLNQDNPEVENFLLDAASFWMDETDIDGFKLHAVDQASESFLQNFSAQIKEMDEDFYLLGDILQTDERAAHLKENTDIDLIENQDLYESMTEVFSEEGNPVSALVETWEESGSHSDILYVDNMYTERFTQKFTENGRNDLTTWTLALTYMYTTPGVPSLFQGSEIPVYGEDAEESQRLVNFNSGNDEVKEFLSQISSLRTEFPALSHGDFEHVGSSGAMSVFKRTYEDETMYIAINNDSVLQSVTVSDIDPGMQLRGHLGDNIVRENEDGEHRIGLEREMAEVFVVEPDTGFNWTFIGVFGGIFLLFVAGVIYLSLKQKKRSV
ncbi:alpha-amylase [Virgibacillus sp. NKC19-16]|uniref:alpha-amylase family glycosyl hydrolase n=1 Tax=Virgibacillus salidurans TaxID=2831673 RepID=UPI001EEB92FB|nr:alpha-amylase family glycosyl hydrolase [Virgibacillus sp. NKC19-16]UJL47602.1 alpha-amylase [Virgibacillus sp. NKC19-16]